MRPLTIEEKAKSTAAKQRANDVLHQRRRDIGRELRSLSAITRSLRRSELLREFERLKDVTGQPVLLRVGDSSITLDYSVVRRLTRNMRNWSAQILQFDERKHLTIRYENARSKGATALYELPQYRRELLKDLPVIAIADETQ